MNLTFTGCSFSADEHCYPNILADHYNAEIKNFAVHGNSNQNIFMVAARELLLNPPDIIFVQWSAIHRIWVYPEPGTHSIIVVNHTTKKLGTGFTKTSKDNCEAFSEEFLMRFGKMWTQLYCEYHHIITLIDYCNILSNLAKGKCRIIFINGLVPWTRDILDYTEETDLSSLSSYTKELINFSTSPDSEIRHYLNKLKLAISVLDTNEWINMFDSVLNNRIDTVSLGDYHPGPATHQQLARKIINKLDS